MSTEQDFHEFAVSEMLCDGITNREKMLMRRAWNAATTRAAKLCDQQADNHTEFKNTQAAIGCDGCASAIRGEGRQA